MSEDMVVKCYTGCCFGGNAEEDELSRYKLGCQIRHPLLPAGIFAKSHRDN